MNTTYMELLISLLVTFFVAAIIWWFWIEEIPFEDTTGERGAKRTLAIKNSIIFKMLCPIVSMGAYHLRGVPLLKLRHYLANQLKKGGSPLGLSPDEFLTITIFSVIGAIALGGIATTFTLGQIAPGVVLGFIFGMAAPAMKLDDVIRQRIREICRDLPHAIDLIALTMKAGLDMPGAITQVSKRLKGDDPIGFELTHLLHKFSLGHSRQAALEQLAERVPAPVVQQFVGAVIQADKQGTPLAEVLSVQAAVMRTRRSQKAEQAAARAAILIIGPLMLIFTCVFIVLIGPFIIKAMKGELF